MFYAPNAFVAASVGSDFNLKMAYDHLNRSAVGELTPAQEMVLMNLQTQVFNKDSNENVEIEDTIQEKAGVYVKTMAYNSVTAQRYFLVPLVVFGVACGTLCFVKQDSSSNNNISFDTDTLNLMAEGVARMIEIQRTKKNRIEESRGFATSGVKSLEEYTVQAKLPEVYGIPGRVLEVLNRRIGHMPLSIDHIAGDLNLSKRTLQRRLQQQQVSFAELRDQIRFHHSIDYLIHQTLSIDAISTALDFSDRTSFTNAFKRWTSLSPSTFRKLFRDYT